jgi:hypothetical protein
VLVPRLGLVPLELLGERPRVPERVVRRERQQVVVYARAAAQLGLVEVVRPRALARLRPIVALVRRLPNPKP